VDLRSLLGLEENGKGKNVRTGLCGYNSCQQRVYWVLDILFDSG